MFRIILCLILLLPAGAAATEIKPFKSDGCSLFPDGTREQNDLWLACCMAHDHAYWKGGTYQQRLLADKALEACVAKVGEPDIARLMLAGVRVGGTPFLPTTFRWGFGWPYPRGYKALSADEIKQIKLFSPDEFKPLQ
ncbi:hypothetical protein [Arsukibacterium sp.]|uniref:hypothetical protein n=1 Tax=Arsukibacterium sp. TaxID=1977258 RepID=UPI00299EB45C|nr:hypothetical protein [Arsukibacterium sp.]MDX1678146.1 hypothetical protein [Arsukibacterium sp.]